MGVIKSRRLSKHSRSWFDENFEKKICKRRKLICICTILFLNFFIPYRSYFVYSFLFPSKTIEIHWTFHIWQKWQYTSLTGSSFESCILCRKLSIKRLFVVLLITYSWMVRVKITIWNFYTGFFTTNNFWILKKNVNILLKNTLCPLKEYF